MASTDVVAIHAIWALVVLAIAFLATGLLGMCMLKRKFVDVDDGGSNDGGNGNINLPPVTLQGASSSTPYRDMSDPLACKHINENGNLCNAAPAPSGDTYSRRSKAERHSS